MAAESFWHSLIIYRRLLGYLKPLKTPFALSIFGFALFAASQPMLAKLMELIIAAIEGKDADARWVLPAVAIGVFLFRGVGTFLGVYYNDLVGASVVRAVKLDIFKQLIVLPAEFYDATSQGQLLHRLTSGVAQIQAAVTTAIKTLVREGLTIICLLVYIFYLNWQLSLVFLLIAPVLALMVSHTTRYFRKIARKNEAALGTAMQVSKEMIGNYGVVRGFGAENYEAKRYQRALDSAFRSELRIRRVQAIFSPLSQLIIAIAAAVIIFLLLTPSILEGSSTGELVGYLTAVLLIPKPLRQLSGVSLIIQRGVVGAELIFDILDQPPEVDRGTLAPDHVDGSVTVKNLTFGYPSSEQPVLKSISLDIKPGEMVALVGRSGSGKSTFASLLYRLYAVPEQTIFLDGHDVNDYRLASIRKHVGIVNQNISLFDDTIRNNVAYGENSYSDAQVIDALKQAHAWEFVARLPKGLDTVIGENGFKLSGGQRQRLSIARAFLREAAVLILDEATSSLDNESEALITQAIETLASTRTTLVIAHRLSTVKRADRLLVLHEGEIVEEGEHEALLAKQGYYADLFHAEFKEA